MQGLADRTAVAIEVSVLVAQPEACWPLLLKVLLMRNSLAASILLIHLLRVDQHVAPEANKQDCCGGFLCGPTAGCWVEGSKLSPSEVLSALLLVMVLACGEPEGGGSKALATALAPLLHQDCAMDWSCLDRRQVWAEKRRPAWLSSLVGLAKDALGSLSLWADSIESVLEGMSVLADTIPLGLIMTSKLLDDILPADVNPFGGCVLMQLLGAAAYAQLSSITGDTSTKLAEDWCNLNVSLHAEKITTIITAANERLE